MTRDLRMLGLTALAALALGAVGAQGAAAEAIPHSFTSAVEPTELTGSGEVHEWKLGEAETVMKCTKSTLTGFLATTSADELNLTPEFSGCKIGATALSFKNSGCKTAFDSDTSDNPDTGLAEDGVVSLNCGHSGSLTFSTTGEAETISIHFFDTHPAEVPVNQQLHGATYTVSKGAPTDLTIKSHLSRLTFVCTGKCGVLGLEKGTGSATTLGSFTVKGYSDEAHTNQVSLGLTTP